MAHDWKSCMGLPPSRVRISPSPPTNPQINISVFSGVILLECIIEE